MARRGAAAGDKRLKWLDSQRNDGPTHRGAKRSRNSCIEGAVKCIAAAAELPGLNATLLRAETLFLDTEFESNRSGTELCLMQISTGSEIFLVDAIALRDLTPLADAFQRAALWVLHAGQQDVTLLGERLRLQTRPRVFDTQVAWSLCTVEHSVSLAYAQFRALGLRGGKAHQADDWVRRPLPASQLSYAAADVEHLPRLYAFLAERVSALGRAELVPLASAETVFTEPKLPTVLSLESFRNAWQLDHRGQAALRYLIDWFNALPEREREQAPENKTLLSLAGRLPTTLADLQRIKGVPRGWSRELGLELVDGLTRAANAADGAGFVPIDPPAYATKRELRVDGWLAAARAELCVRLEVAPELALPSRLVKVLRAHALAHGAADLGQALDGWRKTLLEAPLAEFARHFPLEI
jgi:ribonuclease D